MARAQGQRRDEFPQSVKDTLGRRVGYLCSRCYISTLGPTTDPHRSSNTGVAAHITAAASGGPRYDANLTPEERKAATNGIWCCAICGKLVDDDDSRFTETELREIKAIAEHAADVRRDLAQRHASELINAESLSRVAALASHCPKHAPVSSGVALKKSSSMWGEALDFAVEDLVASGSLDTAAALVRWMMPVGLVAAAELAALAGPLCGPASAPNSRRPFASGTPEVAMPTRKVRWPA